MKRLFTCIVCPNGCEIEAEYEKAAAEKNLVKAMYVSDPDFSDFKVLNSLDEVTVQKIVEENLDVVAQAVAFADDEIQQKIFFKEYQQGLEWDICYEGLQEVFSHMDEKRSRRLASARHN